MMEKIGNVCGSWLIFHKNDKKRVNLSFAQLIKCQRNRALNKHCAELVQT